MPFTKPESLAEFVDGEENRRAMDNMLYETLALSDELFELQEVKLIPTSILRFESDITYRRY